MRRDRYAEGQVCRRNRSAGGQVWAGWIAGVGYEKAPGLRGLLISWVGLVGYQDIPWLIIASDNFRSPAIFAPISRSSG